MFRLVKVINGNIQYENHKITAGTSNTIAPGCALTCQNGTLATPTATSMPDFIAISSNHGDASKKIDVMMVTEDMVFKVEFTGTVTPTLGMSVGLSTKINKMDAVTYNANGKGTVIGIDNMTDLVYVKFRK
jgi:hypothetical protein